MFLAERNSFVSDVPRVAVSMALLSQSDSPVQLSTTFNSCLQKGTCHRYPSYLLSPISVEDPICYNGHISLVASYFFIGRSSYFDPQNLCNSYSKTESVPH
jgi:hypothetical protein